MSQTEIDDKEAYKKDHESEKKKVNLDTILIEEIGQFGKYQLKTFCICIVFVIFVSWSASEYVFTTTRTSARCLIPQCDSTTPEYAPSWILNAVPGSSLTSFESCERFANVSDTFDQTCPASLFDQQTTVPCDQYVYENAYTVVYDYDLPCDEWKRSFIGTFRTFGTLTALPITGYMSDRWGRRFTLSFNAFNTAWLGLVRYWADTYWGFTISEFIESTFGSGGFSCAYILLMEVVGPKYRVAVGAAMNTTFSIGLILLGLIAWAVPYWRDLTLVLYIPQLITIGIFWTLNESIRWLLSKEKFREAEVVLKKVAKVNGRQVSDKYLQQIAVEEKKRKELEQVDRVDEPWLIVLVFRNKPILLRCVVSPVWWFTSTLVYYGLSINAVNLSGNRYLNYIAVSAVEIPGYWTAVVLMGLVGRKPVLIGAYWSCAVCQIAYIFISSDLFELSLAFYLIGKFSIAMVATSIYVYTAELYPTKYRHSLFAFSSMIGRIGNMVAPLTPAIGDAVWEDLPFALFAGFSLLSGLLLFLTPETLGSKLPDTMEDAVALGNKKETKL